MTALRDQLQVAMGHAYAVERELGGGGWSRGFVAIEAALGRTVVIKVVPADLAAGLSIARFMREVKLAARLQHANVIPPLNAGEAGGMLYYTRPFIDGLTLRERLAEFGRMETDEAMRVLRDVAKALTYAHANGVVHHDLRPENIILSSGTAMVTDFGVAKALIASRTPDGSGDATTATSVSPTLAARSLGTPAYTAPEQALGGAVDLRADLYTWGVIAYELITGAHPFDSRATPQQLIAAHIAELPVPIGRGNPALPAALASVVMRCLEKDPDKRPVSAADLVVALDNAARPHATPVGMMVAGDASPSPSPPRTGGYWTAVALVLACIAVVVWLVLRR